MKNWARMWKPKGPWNTRLCDTEIERYVMKKTNSASILIEDLIQFNAE